MGKMRAGWIACLALVAPVVLAQPPTYADLQSRRSSHAIQSEAWQIVVLANQARAAAGAGPLKWDPALAAAARQHCLRMAAEGPISHRYAGEADLERRAGQAGAHFSLIEENVAIAPTPASIHSAWMHSPGHRSNLLNPNVDRVGVAVVAGRGGLYAVADYERAVPVLTQAQVETAIGGLLRDSGITLRSDSTEARAYCTEDRDIRSGKQPGFRMLWQGADVNRLPQALMDRIASGRYRDAAVGSCPAQDLDGSFTAYRVAVLLY
jgi:cysteine-rich secretory family protein